MERAGDMLGRAVRRLERPEAALAWLEGVWPNVVGKTLAAHTRPLRCSNGSLEIAADTASWRKQLEAVKAELCARINKAWGGHLVRQVEFAAPKPGPGCYAADPEAERNPFIRRRKP